MKNTRTAARKAPRASSTVAGKAPVRARQAAATKQAPKKAPGPTSPPAAPEAKARKAAHGRMKLVRDGFTMPDADFALIATLKARALGAQRAAKKSELLRAGLHALAALDGKTLVAALDRLVPIKTGRPKKG